MIEHKIVNNAIEKAQRRVGENNYGIRSASSVRRRDEQAAHLHL